MTDPRIQALQQIRELSSQAASGKAQSQEIPETSFKDMMKNYIEEANDMQVEADDSIRSIIAGEDIDPHQVMLAVEKANMSFNLVMQIRNKMLEAYKEVIKTSV